jgi:hypothetical protein
MWKLGLWDKYIHKYIYDHIYKIIYICIYRERTRDYNNGVMELWGSRRRQENDREWIILKHIPSVYESSIPKLIESYWIIGEQGNREWVSNRGG